MGGLRSILPVQRFQSAEWLADAGADQKYLVKTGSQWKVEFPK